MKRYWLFIYPRYEPIGGMHDIDSVSDDIPTLLERLRHVQESNRYYDSYHIIDMHMCRIVRSSYADNHKGGEADLQFRKL